MVGGQKEQEFVHLPQQQQQQQQHVGIQNNEGGKRAEFEEETTDPNFTHTTSDCGALLHIVKGSLGGGVFAMPYAFKHAGLAFGVVAACFIGIIVTHTMAMLIDCSQNLCKIFNKPRMSYSDTAEYAFLYARKGKLKKYAHMARRAADFFQLITCYGILTYFVLMISSSMQQITNDITGANLDIRIYTLLVIFLVFPVGIIKLLKYLVPFSALANILLLIALGLICCDIFSDLPPVNSRPAIQPAIKWPIFFATSFLSMEAIGMILPLENEMKNPTHLTHSSRLLYVGMVFSGLINIFVGYFGYLKYGDDVKGLVSLNLNQNNWLSPAVKITTAVAILMTFGLQMAAPTKVVWDAVRPYVRENKAVYYYVLRASLIIGNVLIATAMPSLGGIIGLIGSLGFATLGIFIPALLELVCLPDENLGCLNWKFIKDLLLIVFAVFCAIAGVYCSIKEMMSK